MRGKTSVEFLEALHRRERERNYLLSNWNIQKLAGLPTIKEYHGIPNDDAEAHLAHRDRIEREILKVGFFHSPPQADLDAVDEVHALDWFVLRNMEKIDWGYAGATGKRGGILKRLEVS
jgi:hypothetical protein